MDRPLDNRQAALALDVSVCGDNPGRVRPSFPSRLRRSIGQLRTVAKRSANPRLIVICGSMIHHGAMLTLQRDLEQYGIRSIVPEDERHLGALDPAGFLRFKKDVSERYFDLIRQRKVWGIVVLNLPKNGTRNYIGGNTFAELAVAISARKRVYLFDDFYEPYKDELLAWQVVPLKGQLPVLLRSIREHERSADTKQVDVDLLSTVWSTTRVVAPRR